MLTQSIPHAFSSLITIAAVFGAMMYLSMGAFTVCTCFRIYNMEASEEDSEKQWQVFHEAAIDRKHQRIH